MADLQQKQTIPWNKGKKNVISENTRLKMSESAKKRVARGILPNNKGKSPWNKGKTAKTDNRIAKYANSQKGQIRTGNWDSHTRWIGNKNPWYGKSRAGDKSPRYNKTIHSRKYKNYYNKVLWETEKNYILNIDKINPKNHPRTLCGISGGWQLDHIYPISEGFKNNKSVEEIAAVSNLRIIPWKENLTKSNKI